MKKYSLLIIAAFLGLVGMTSCGDDFLSAESAKKAAVGDPATENTISSNLASAYQILLFDSYANNNYNSIQLMSDLRSDDSFKGGESAGDQQQLFDLATFNSTSTSTIGGLWSIYYSGIARCNNTIIAADNAVQSSNPNVVKRYKAEALFLRAYYAHLLWKFWGNIPYFTEPLEKPFVAPQYKADEVYAKIMEDIKAAEDLNILQWATKKDSVGRANKAALLMLKARVVMYQKDASKYAEVANDMASIIKSNSYSLFADFGAMWDDQNEFCSESIFESNQLPQGKTWASGWQGYGTNYPAYVSPNELKDPNNVFKGGWGFGPLRSSVLDLFETGDTRLDGSINNWIGGDYTPRFQDTGIFQRKYAARVGYNNLPGDQDLNYANNLRIFRYAETLLNYAELVGVLNVASQQGVSAQDCFDQVRSRAFGGNAPALTLNSDNLKLERHREFVGEGMRFWDLIRWGDAEKVLSESITVTTPGNAKKNPVTWSWSRTFTSAKKYLPISENDINATIGTAYPLEQNPGW